MMELRISSLLALASSVFMRRIRRLVYASVMNDERFRKKVMPVLIYNLLEVSVTGRSAGVVESHRRHA